MAALLQLGGCSIINQCLSVGSVIDAAKLNGSLRLINQINQL